MGSAFAWGVVSASSLVIGWLVAIWLHISLRARGLFIDCAVFLGGDWAHSRG